MSHIGVVCVMSCTGVVSCGCRVVWQRGLGGQFHRSRQCGPFSRFDQVSSQYWSVVSVVSHTGSEWSTGPGSGQSYRSGQCNPSHRSRQCSQSHIQGWSALSLTQEWPVWSVTHDRSVSRDWSQWPVTHWGDKGNPSDGSGQSGCGH